MGATLGLRLDSAIEQRLETLARLEGRSKSEIARAALDDYLHRHDIEGALRRDAESIAAYGAAHLPSEDDLFIEALSNEVRQALDE